MKTLLALLLCSASVCAQDITPDALMRTYLAMTDARDALVVERDNAQRQCNASGTLASWSCSRVAQTDIQIADITRDMDSVMQAMRAIASR